MRKLLLLPLLLLSLALGPVQDFMRSVAYLEFEVGHCSTFSVGLKRWITAAHCLKDEKWFKINGIEVQAIKVDEKLDLALTDGPIVTPIELSKNPPKEGDPVFSAGWPGDYPGKLPLIYSGTVAAVRVEGLATGRKVSVFDMGTARGMSGGPIVNSEGKLVGIIQQFHSDPHVMTVSVNYDELKKFLK